MVASLKQRERERERLRVCETLIFLVHLRSWLTLVEFFPLKKIIICNIKEAIHYRVVQLILITLKSQKSIGFIVFNHLEFFSAMLSILNFILEWTWYLRDISVTNTILLDILLIKINLIISKGIYKPLSVYIKCHY